MNNRWNELLSNYYDHVAATFLKQISQEYELNYEELLEKSIHVKSEILNSATQNVTLEPNNVKKKKPSMSALKNARKAEIDSKREKNIYSNFTRTELINKCKERKLPVKRKNQDMVDKLLEYDNENSEDNNENPEDNNNDIEN
jgi:hypothetical protein